MSKHWAALLLGLFVAAMFFIASIASAAPPTREGIENMYGQCRCVMEGGECRVSNRPPARGPVVTSSGPVSGEAYNWIRSHGGLMCQAGRDECIANWNGERCFAFRTMFRQTPFVCVKNR